MSDLINNKENKNFDTSFQENLEKINEWNSQNADKKSRVLSDIHEFLNEYKELNEGQILTRLNNISSNLHTLSLTTHEKLKLSFETLDLVENLFFKLNQTKLESLIQDNILSSDPPTPSDDSDTTLTSNHSNPAELSYTSHTRYKQSRKMVNHESSSSDENDNEEEQMSPTNSSFTLKRNRDESIEAINSDEITYCYCKQISYGEMVACDGDDCAIEWFHYPCVDLKSPPKGKWYCHECLEKLKKHKE